VARLTGLEPATPGVTGRYSNQLSYNRAETHGSGMAAVARLTGLEPATPGVTGRYSNQLSYNRPLPNPMWGVVRPGSRSARGRRQAVPFRPARFFAPLVGPTGDAGVSRRAAPGAMAHPGRRGEGCRDRTRRLTFFNVAPAPARSECAKAATAFGRALFWQNKILRRAPEAGINNPLSGAMPEPGGQGWLPEEA
jgi:hypothetical protein